MQPGNHEILAERIEQVINNIILRNELSQKAIARADLLYDAEKVSQQINDMYLSLFGQIV